MEALDRDPGRLWFGVEDLDEGRPRPAACGGVLSPCTLLVEKLSDSPISMDAKYPSGESSPKAELVSFLVPVLLGGDPMGFLAISGSRGVGHAVSPSFSMGDVAAALMDVLLFSGLPARGAPRRGKISMSTSLCIGEDFCGKQF